MMTVSLTSNAIARVCNGQQIDTENSKPILQVIDIRSLSAAGQPNSAERYRMLLSDGVHMQQGMLASQMNHLVHESRLQKGSIVELSQFVSQEIQTRKIIIIVDLNVIVERCDQIGFPVMFGQGVGCPNGGIAPHPSVDHARNPQSYAGPAPGALHAPNVAGRAAAHNPRLDTGSTTQSYRSPFNDIPDSRGFPTTNGPLHQAPATVASSDIDQNRNFTNNRHEGGGSRVPYIQPIYHQQAPMNRGPIAKNDALPRITPIAALNPYSNKWAIKARVTAKKNLRNYSNSRGDGKVFSFDVLDSDGGEIQVTCFNAVADQFYNMIEEGRVYVISMGSVRQADKIYNHLNNEFTVHLESTSTVEFCPEDDAAIPRQQFNFRSISDIERMGNNSIVDLIGVVTSIFPTASIKRKTDGKDTLKKSLQLKDMSGRSVDLTLWGDFCEVQGKEVQTMVDDGVFPVLAVKGGRVTDFNGKSVGTLFTSQLFINPDFADARSLSQWFKAEGKSIPFVSISRDTVGLRETDRKTVSQIKDENLGKTRDKADWICVKGKVTFIKTDNFCYMACPNERCRKKINNDGDGTWRCDKCEANYRECDYRYLLAFQIQDHTGGTWVTAFQETGKEIIGGSAKDLYILKHEEQDNTKFAEIIKKVVFQQYMFKLKVKEELYNDEARIKSTAVKVEKVDFQSESRYLLDLIERSVADPNAIFGATPPSITGMIKQENMGVSPSYGGGGQYGGLNARPAAAVINNNITGVSVVCKTCRDPGHSYEDCPSNNSRFINNNAMGGECYRCNQTGHWAKDCPASAQRYGPPQSVAGYGGVGVSNHRVG